MSAPVVTWTDASDITNVLSSWNMGKVNAGEYAGEKHIYIWNNKGGTEDLSNMQDVQITTQSETGECDVVDEHWIQVRCVSTPKDAEEDTEFYEIGGETTHTLTAQDCEEGVISGAANSGLANDITNYASIVLNCKVPANASAGARKLNTRIIYYYT